MAIRDLIPGAPLTMADHASDLDAKFGALFDAGVFPLTSVAGTNAVTATLVPALDGDGLQEGMTFSLTWANTNTGNVTLAINGGAALAVNQIDGTAIPAGGAEAGSRALVQVVGGVFRLLTAVGGDAGTGRSYEVITATQVWTPPDLADDTPVDVHLWAGGGGGHSSGGGGGGGGYFRITLRLGDLGSSVTCTIGAGGAVGAAGGNTTFGTFATAYGGGAGNSTNGGGGGGSRGAGGTPTGGKLGGGVGGMNPVPDPVVPPDDASTDWAGGGGSYSGAGGAATFGGGGGGGVGTGGASVRGGDGGDDGVAGSAPSGGGGKNAAGARGEIIIII